MTLCFPRAALAASLLIVLAALPAAAQVFTPSFQAPRSSADIGLYLSDGPGNFGLEGILRRNFGGYDLGLRLGVADMDDAALLLGAELRNPFQVTDVPLDFAFTGGVQAVLSSRTGAGFIVGLSAGHTFVPGDFSITPYIHPRVGLVQLPRRGDDLTARVLADIGVDFNFQPNLAFRLGFGLGRPTADWGIGLAWR